MQSKSSTAQTPVDKLTAGLNLKDTAKKMEYYSSQFPCVEIDSTSYAFPTDATIETWIKATPEGFRFHLKPLGILCGLSIRTAALPRPIREDSKKQQVSLSDLSHESVEYLWHRTNTLFLKFADAERLGCAIFQFPLSFKPGEGQLDKVLLCRQRLHERVPMAVEFRERLWLTGAQLEKTVTFCRAHNLALVIADDLKHELYWPERERLGLDPGKPEQMPMPVRLSHRDFLFARIHRREGKMRLLSDEEVAAWGRRVRSVLDDGLLEEQLQFERTKAATTATEEAEEGSAPVTSTQAQEVAEAASTSSSKPKRVVRFDILVGTDVEDQSVVNARRIRDACGELGLRWDDHCKEEAIGWYSKKRSSAQALTNFFGAVPAEAQVESAYSSLSFSSFCREYGKI